MRVITLNIWLFIFKIFSLFKCQFFLCERNYRRHHSQSPTFIGKLTTYTPKVLPEKFPRKPKKVPSTCPPMAGWQSCPAATFRVSVFLGKIGKENNLSGFQFYVAMFLFLRLSVYECCRIYVYNSLAKIKIVFLWRARESTKSAELWAPSWGRCHAIK